MPKKHKTHKLSTKPHFSDTLFIDQKIRGCESQLTKIEGKLIKLKAKTGLSKLLVMKDIEQLTRSCKEYEKYLKQLHAIKAKQMERKVLMQDALQDVKDSYSRFTDMLNIPANK